MEKLIIIALVLLGSVISNYFQNKKKREEEELEKRATGPRPTGGEPPIPHWPKTGGDWQEELRRVLQGKAQPPPIHQTNPPAPTAPAPTASARTTVPRAIVRTKVVLPTSPKAVAERSEGDLVFPTPLKQSSTAYARASQLAGQVESRLQAVDAQTEAHKPTAPARKSGSSSARVARRWTRDRESLREAFIASLIFGPPVGLRD